MPSSDRVAIIGTVGVPSRYGGFETLAEQLVTRLSDRYRLTVYCSRPAYPERPATFQNARLRYIPLNANGPQSIAYDVWSMLDAMTSHDVILVLGVSGTAALPVIRRISRARIVVNIDGLEWKRAKWGAVARQILRRSEALAVRHADVVIADNQVIVDSVRERYGVEAQLIEYGGDHARRELADPVYFRSMGVPEGPYAFTVCRVEPENNLHLILEGVARAKALPLVAVGNWHRSDYGRQLRRQFGGRPDIVLLDPIYEQRRLDALRSNCAVYLHGHSAGGTNPSLVEAMSLGLAIFAHDVSYNRETTEGRARYFATASELAELLRTVSRGDLDQISAQMQAIAQRRYTWERIARRYEETFTGRSKGG
ncbi:MAG: DUF1972 domain-containing protein [Myxococcaceae bacterium]|nr:DUF1972 domain-containing protein [Myxococcaceae bacterium]